MIRNLLFYALYAYFHWRFAKSCNIRDQAAAYLDGDIMIGGIIPINSEVTNILNRTGPDDSQCALISLRNIFNALSMMYTIEEINNSPLLPGIKLGYAIYDSCGDASKAIQSTIKLFPELNALYNPPSCSTKIVSAVKAVIGEINSEISVAISRILSLHSIPQVSPASSAEELSDTIKFPSFLRTVPSDVHQTKAIAKIIKKFQWNWIAVIASNDNYGQSAAKNLNLFLTEDGICTAFMKFISTKVTDSEIHSITDTLQMSTANVIVVFAKTNFVGRILKESIALNITKTWIATDNWSSSREVASVANIEKVGTVIGFNFQAEKIPGFMEYLQNIQTSRDGENNQIIKEYKTFLSQCRKYKDYHECISSLSNCSTTHDCSDLKFSLSSRIDNDTTMLASDDYLLQYINLFTVYSTHLAVQSVVYALQNILCKNGKCAKDLQFLPQELVNGIKNVRIPKSGYFFYFDKKGAFVNGYDIINWNTLGSVTLFNTVGHYNIVSSELTLNKSLLMWHTENNTVPESNCSKACPPGYFKKHIFPYCCFECSPCSEGYYLPEPDSDQCRRCEDKKWSRLGSSQCEERRVEYFNWKDPFAIAQMTFATFACLLLLTTFCLFIKYNNTLIVKAAVENYTYVVITSLLISLTSTYLFIGEPSDTVCKVRQPLYGISFTLCISCILIKSLQFNFPVKRVKFLTTLTNYPLIILGVLNTVQIFICTLWLTLNGPYYTIIYSIPEIELVQCEEGSHVLFSAMLGYIAFLALICFIFAYKGKKLPEKYNEARGITFAMLIYMFVWIVFIPLYMNTAGTYHSAVQVVAILASAYAMIVCHLLPTCYIILFKNNKEDTQSILPSKLNKTANNMMWRVNGCMKQRANIINGIILLRRRRWSI
uniref:G-protein coupled receptors family 3 profile domain-containing protein n=1 Tax=Leptobrachium leishanense TaxID=445787 RepID=A0A8C5PHV5_9ANUR